ncbi:hypothetical protein DFH28DRAFT_464469 [Melampsora americana]|nr:hypothetical protein DFH28DRAFT_464469 [Melampsora americana]
MAVQNSDLASQDSTMLRSTRIRKPSQKAKEIAEAIQPLRSPPGSTKSHKTARSAAKPKSAPKPKKRRIVITAKVKAGGKKGRAVVDADGDVQIEEIDSQQFPTHPEEEDDDDALYCICLGHDDHTPMIQCEECENWFHFACIQLDPSEASVIKAFYCDVCEASGSGKTQSKLSCDIIARLSHSFISFRSLPHYAYVSCYSSVSNLLIIQFFAISMGCS